MESENDSDTNSIWCTWNDSQRLGKRQEVLDIRGRIETIQTTVLLRSRYLEKSRRPEELCCYSVISEKWCEKLANSELTIMIITLKSESVLYTKFSRISRYQ